MILLLIAVYGALRHPVATVRQWWSDWRASRHPDPPVT